MTGGPPARVEPADPACSSCSGRDAAGPRSSRRALGDVPGVEALGEVVHLPERALRDDELCACGLAFSHCPFWVAVGKSAFDGWDRVDADELIALRHEVVRTRHLPRLLAGSPTSGGRLRRDALVERLDALYRAAAEESGARLLVDSSKMPAWAALVAHADVDVHFLHVVRDPRGVAYSLRQGGGAARGGRDRPHAPHDAEASPPCGGRPSSWRPRRSGPVTRAGSPPCATRTSWPTRAAPSAPRSRPRAWP